jgi:hypothetical protein
MRPKLHCRVDAVNFMVESRESSDQGVMVVNDAGERPFAVVRKRQQPAKSNGMDSSSLRHLECQTESANHSQQ